MTIKKIAAAMTSVAMFLSALAPVALAQNHEHHYEETHSQSFLNTNYHYSESSNIINQHTAHIGKLFTFMDGDQEVPGPGDPDGFGITKLRINPDSGEICVKMRVHFIEPATAAHIHAGVPGVAGDVIVTLPTPNAEGRANGCVNTDPVKAQDIQNNSTHYYVNVHNAQYPAGAIRGQL